MPSTFSARLGVELQANGENLLTWGEIANRGFKLLEEGISGYVEITISGNTTLTSTDGMESSGGTDQARNHFLKLTGAPGAAFTLTLPEVEKNWVVWNATGSVATIRTATETATIALGENRIVSVQSDGVGSVLAVTPPMSDSGTIPATSIENFGVFSTITATIGATLAGLTYPAADGAAGQYITTDGAGNLSFGTPSGAGDMLSTANLSDLTDVSAAVATLGLAPRPASDFFRRQS